MPLADSKVSDALEIKKVHIRPQSYPHKHICLNPRTHYNINNMIKVPGNINPGIRRSAGLDIKRSCRPGLTSAHNIQRHKPDTVGPHIHEIKL